MLNQIINDIMEVRKKNKTSGGFFVWKTENLVGTLVYTLTG